LEIRKELASAFCVYRLKGRLDASTAPIVDSAIAVDEQTACIILDMREVTYVSSGGLRAVVQVARRAQAAKGGIALFGLQPLVGDIFEVAGLGNMIPIASDEAGARSKLGVREQS
jgi:anti-anti-sigma factor